MTNNKTYTVVKPALNMILYTAVLTDTGIATFLSKDGITKQGAEEILYTAIQSINISVIDVNRNEICIKTKEGKKIKLINLSLGKLIDGKIKRITVDQTIEFNNWISELHRILLKKNLAAQIDFTTGSNAKTFMFVVLLIGCLVACVLAFSINKIGLVAVMVGGIFTTGTMLFKLGLKKEYDPQTRILS